MQTFSERVKQELSLFKYEGAAVKALLSSFLANNLIIHINNKKEW
jgi:DNA-binding transcriptional regulator WhiA